MKKSNKVSVFYVISSVTLLLTLLIGGIYGIYLSIGLNFVKSSVSNIADAPVGSATNVSYGGTVNFETSMTGVIILSIILIVLAVIDFISLIKQVTFFKQFKLVRESGITKKIEKKTKSKGAVIFFAVVIDLLSIAAGIAGIFINMRSFVGNNMAWVLYTIDAVVSLLALVSLVLLIIKLKNKKKWQEEFEKNHPNCKDMQEEETHMQFNINKNLCELNKNKFDIDEMEYNLLKLKNLKASKIISAEEYQHLHDHLLGLDKKPSCENPEETSKN